MNDFFMIVEHKRGNTFSICFGFLSCLQASNKKWLTNHTSVSFVLRLLLLAVSSYWQLCIAKRFCFHKLSLTCHFIDFGPTKLVEELWLYLDSVTRLLQV